MKISRIIGLSVIAVAICVTLVLNNSFAQDRTKRQARATTVAVCNVFTVLKNCQETKDRTAKTKEIETEVKAELQKRLNAINDIKAEMEQLDPDSSEYERRADQIDELSLQAKMWHELKSKKVIREEIKAHIAMYERLQEAAKQIASENGIDIVLFQSEFDMPQDPSIELLSARMRERIVLYSSNNVDITEPILVRYNELYKAGKSK